MNIQTHASRLPPTLSTEAVKYVQLLDDLDIEGIAEIHSYLSEKMPGLALDGMLAV